MGQGPSGPAVTVIQAVDGDIIDVTPHVDGRERVRLIGVDTPEVGQPYAQEASTFTRERLEGQRVAVEFDVQRIDPYNRLLAYVYLPDGSMFNQRLVWAGYAQVATFPPNVKYTDRFLAVQQRARAAGRGLWGLSKGEQCDLTNRENGIGEGSAGCTAPAQSTSPPPSKEGVPPISQTACPKNAPIKAMRSPASTTRGPAPPTMRHTPRSASLPKPLPKQRGTEQPGTKKAATFYRCR